MGGSGPSCWEGPSLLFQVRVEARRAKARGPKGRERGRVLEASPVPPDRGSGAVSSPSEVR